MVARLRFAEACGDVDTDLTAVGGISSREECCGNEDVECFSRWDLEGIGGKGVGLKASLKSGKAGRRGQGREGGV
jgi:hypothetical protein